MTMHADVLPYAQPGHLAPTVPLTAATTGQIVGYFYGSEAGGTDYVRLLDVTSGFASPFLLSNHASMPGQSVSFGFVTAGDTLIFQLVNSDVEGNKDGTDFSPHGPFDPNAQMNGWPMASDPAYSVDGLNHAYVASFSGSTTLGIPAGVYLGMEDLPFGAADLDYNDTQFVFTNVAPVTTAMTPEPSSFVLMATGVFGAAAVFRRHVRR